MSRGSPSGEPMPVAVLGATGLVGQHLVRLLDGHPTLRLAEVAASPRRAGKAYADAVDWVVSASPPVRASQLRILATPDEVRSSLVLSALPASAARLWEPALAAADRVICSNASAHRMDERVPLVVPEVNPEALGVARDDPGSEAGRIVANPNCVVTGIALALAPIERRWGIGSGAVVTLQALSGAGLSGPSALALTGNVVPWIAGEEEKVEAELRKILGSELSLAVTVNRVPVVDGHMAHLFLRLRSPARADEVRDALAAYEGEPEVRALPSVPPRPLALVHGDDRPQPRLDAGRGDGMVVSVGRVRAAAPFDIALTLVVHNAIRGAAGACLANAELVVARGLVREVSRAPRQAS